MRRRDRRPRAGGARRAFSVHRRVLYAMFDFISAPGTVPRQVGPAVVAETMGNYHPHGDVDS